MSRCASKCSTATGPCFLLIARSSDVAIVWSPPIVTILSTRSPSSVAAASTAFTASVRSKGLIEMSPASTTCLISNGDVLCRVVRAQQSRSLAYVARAEPSARAKTDATVERSTDDRDVGRRHVFNARKLCESGDARVARSLARIDGPLGRVLGRIVAPLIVNKIRLSPLQP